MTTTNTGWTGESMLETLTNPAAADDDVERSTWAPVDMTTALNLKPQTSDLKLFRGPVS